MSRAYGVFNSLVERISHVYRTRDARYTDCCVLGRDHTLRQHHAPSTDAGTGHQAALRPARATFEPASKARCLAVFVLVPDGASSARSPSS